MLRPQTNPALFVMMFLLALSIAAAFPRERRQFFTTCWGWGAGCSMHTAVGRALVPAASANKPTQRREPTHVYVGRNRFYVGIPSLVTSGGWEPGTMGKRDGPRQERLLAILRQTVVDNYLQV